MKIHIKNKLNKYIKINNNNNNNNFQLMTTKKLNKEIISNKQNMY
jgi:hypothetical protein